MLSFELDYEYIPANTQLGDTYKPKASDIKTIIIVLKTRELFKLDLSMAQSIVRFYRYFEAYAPYPRNTS